MKNFNVNTIPYRKMNAFCFPANNHNKNHQAANANIRNADPRGVAQPQQQQRQRYDLEEPDNYGNTPLLKACYQGKIDQAAMLINKGANLKALNYMGQNALTLAAYSGNCELVKLLLRYRSYADFNNSSIVPAICVAALRQDKQMIQYFRALDRRTDIKTSHGLRADEIYSMLDKKPCGCAPKAVHFRIL